MNMEKQDTTALFHELAAAIKAHDLKKAESLLQQITERLGLAQHAAPPDERSQGPFEMKT